MDTQTQAQTTEQAQTTQPVVITNPNAKIIKRYQNRKLYDTQQSCYVTLEDIAKMIRNNEEVVVIDNKTKKDITSTTLTQIIFEAEKKAKNFISIDTLREIIQTGTGSISSYLEKIMPAGLKPAAAANGAEGQADYLERLFDTTTRSFDDISKKLEDRIKNAAAGSVSDVQAKLTALQQKLSSIESKFRQQELDN